MAVAAIEAIALHKTYVNGRRSITAVAGLDLNVGQSEFFGLLGPNGAGKSTTIGMLTTMIAPTSGRAFVAGIDVTRNPVEVKRRIGMVSQHNTLDRDLLVAENLEFRGRFFGMSGRDARRRAMELLSMFNLADRHRASSYELSGGQAKRLMICRALVHCPQVLFLDEPTAGLDPQSRLDLWDVLRGMHAEGQTIMLTTHAMEEAQMLCGRIAIVEHGTVLACDTVDALVDSSALDTVITVRYDGPAPDSITALVRRPGITKVEVEGGRVRVFARQADGVLGELVGAGAAAGVQVADASQLKPSLEAAFLTLTGREYRG
jgi:ABC-type multidrug transport system ATPase subunit